MGEEGPHGGESAGGPHGEPAWKVDEGESLGRLLKPDGAPGGMLVYVDERGRRHRLPPDMAELPPEELRAALGSALGAPDPDYARLAAVERLTEMRVAGTVGEEDYKRERRRLMGDG